MERAYGACTMYRGALSHLLTNQIYRGVIAFKGDLYEGEHERIVPEELFLSVQALLTAQGPGEAAKKKLASPAILKGILFDENGNRLQPTHSAKHGRKYRYYVSATKIRDAKSNPDGYRIPAADLERIVDTDHCRPIARSKMALVNIQSSSQCIRVRQTC